MFQTIRASLVAIMDVPSFKFGSDELEEFHREMKARNEWMYSYVVDHGKHRTLNTKTLNHRTPMMLDIIEDE